jgi:hypothetical protein
MRDRRAGQAEALAVLRGGLRADAAAYPVALARLPGDLDLDAFVEATAAAALAECDRNDAADGVLAEFDALTKGHN